jgi:hypothetical protein
MSHDLHAAHREMLLRCCEQTRTLSALVADLIGDDGELLGAAFDNLRQSLATAVELAVASHGLDQIPHTLAPGQLTKQALAAELVLCITSDFISQDFDDRAQLEELDALIATIRQAGSEAASAAASRQRSLAAVAELRAAVDALERRLAGGDRTAGDATQRLADLEALARVLADSVDASCEQLRTDLARWLQAQRQLRSPLN